MLHKRALPTQRTHGLLSQPITNALPAENMSTRRRGRVLHRFEAQRAFPLLLPVDPAHGLVVAEIVAVERAFAATAGDGGDGGVGDASEVLALGFGVCGAGSFEEQGS